MCKWKGLWNRYVRKTSKVNRWNAVFVRPCMAGGVAIAIKNNHAIIK